MTQITVLVSHSSPVVLAALKSDSADKYRALAAVFIIHQKRLMKLADEFRRQAADQSVFDSHNSDARRIKRHHNHWITHWAVVAVNNSQLVRSNFKRHEFQIESDWIGVNDTNCDVLSRWSCNDKPTVNADSTWSANFFMYAKPSCTNYKHYVRIAVVCRNKRTVQCQITTINNYTINYMYHRTWSFYMSTGINNLFLLWVTSPLKLHYRPLLLLQFYSLLYHFSCKQWQRCKLTCHCSHHLGFASCLCIGLQHSRFTNWHQRWSTECHQTCVNHRNHQRTVCNKHTKHKHVSISQSPNTSTSDNHSYFRQITLDGVYLEVLQCINNMDSTESV